MSDKKHVYDAINAVTTALAESGIAKNRKNTQGQGYSFRGIDDVYNELSPLLAKNKLCIIPRVISRECVERVSKSGGALYYVSLDVEFDFVSAVDGSLHTARTFGEAMDSSDKATNKAMSAAYKYVCFMTFAIPTEGDNDADAHTPVAEPGQPKTPAPTRKSANIVRTADEIGVLLAKCDNAAKLAEVWDMLNDAERTEYRAMFTARKEQIAQREAA